jgi:hypothetical protein
MSWTNSIAERIFKILVKQLRKEDKISIVVYAGAGLVLHQLPKR